MATKFYIVGGTPTFTPTIKGAWTRHGTLNAYPLDVNKSSGEVDFVYINENVVLAPNDTVFAYRGVSERLQGMILSGTLQIFLGAVKNYPAAQWGWHIHVYVTVGDTNTVRGILLNNFNDFNNWPSFPGPVPINPALSSVSVTAGDRVVVELGIVVRNPGGPLSEGQTWVGTQISGVPAPDLTLGGAPSSRAGWIEFSANLLFIPESTVVEHALVEVSRVAPPSGTEISHALVQSVVPAPVGPINTDLLHIVVQTVVPPPPALPDLSGLYFLNPAKIEPHDSYYQSIELKIPDPTIRTAFMGE